MLKKTFAQAAGDMGDTGQPRAQETERETPQQAAARVQDETVETWLTEAAALARETDSRGAGEVIGGVRTWFASDKATIAIVGSDRQVLWQFASALLDRGDLPAGMLSAPEMAASVIYRERPTLVHRSEDGKRTAYPLQASSWDRLAQGQAGQVHIGVPVPWLRDCDARLLIAEGYGKAAEQAAAMADVVIVCLSALQAMTMEESTFIRARLLDRRVPRQMAFLGRTAQLHDGDVALVTNRVKAELGKLSAELLLVTDTGASDMTVEGARAQITQWLSAEDRAWAKRAQAAVLIREAVDLILSSLDAKAASLALTEGERMKKVQEKRLAVDRLRIWWEELSVDMMKRCNDHLAWLAEVIQDQKQRISESRAYELEHAQDIRQWYEKDYPYRMKLDLQRLATELDQGMQRRYAQDLAWLNHQLEQSRHRVLGLHGPDGELRDQVKDLHQPKPLDLYDTRGSRKVMRLMGTGVMILALSVATGPGIGIAAGTIAGIVFEDVVQNRVQEQQESLKWQLSIEISRLLGDVSAQSATRLRALYTQTMADLGEDQQRWLSAQYAQVEEMKDPEEAQDARERLRAQRAQAQALDARLGEAETA